MEYRITKEEAKSRYIQIFKDTIVPAYPGADKLLDWIQSTDFFMAPASTRFHGSFPGGLCIHSLAVYDNLVRIDRCYGFNLPAASMALCALTHDLCKCNFYHESTRNVKNDETGRWEKVPYYQVQDQYPYGGHGSKSVFLVQSHVRISSDEAAAINSHMGFADQTSMTDISNVYNVNKLAWALHVADEAATYIDKV